MFAKRRPQQNLKKTRVTEEVAKPDKGGDADEIEDEGKTDVAGASTEGATVCLPVEPRPDDNKRRKLLIMTSTARSSNSTKEPKDAEAFREPFESDRSLGVGKDQRATATLDSDPDILRDHRALLERNEAIGKAILAGELEEGVYRGQGAYRPVISRREGAVAAGKYTGFYGPVRGNQHARMTMRIDLNPEICKDYKETGYCGFGDTCIFIHDRSDYKPGWQLEKEWEQQQKEQQRKAARRLARVQRTSGGEETAGSSASADDSSSSADSDEETKVPKICQICHSQWQGSESDPVATKCNHFFCSRCALERYAKTDKCAVCMQPTNGLFNSAVSMIARLAKKPPK